MATFTASWTTGVALHGSSTLANGGTDTDSVNLTTAGYYGIVIQEDINIASGSPNGDILIEILSSSDGGSNTDTEAATVRRINFIATGNKKITIPVLGYPYVTSKVTNNTGVSVTHVSRYAGLKQASA